MKEDLIKLTQICKYFAGEVNIWTLNCNCRYFSLTMGRSIKKIVRMYSNFSIKSKCPRKLGKLLILIHEIQFRKEINLSI